MKTVKVVAAVITASNENGEKMIFATQRGYGEFKDGWEFPGGKVEKGESLHEAIEREIKEELSCTVKAVEIFDENTHEYENIIVNLTAIKCDLVEGSPLADEHSEIIYLKRENLNSLVWAPADMPIVKKVINS